MAVKKWPKWMAGITSVLSFTGFLYLTQSHQTTGAADAAGANAAGNLQLPVQDGAVSKEKNSVRTFVHTRTEFLQVENLSPEAKMQRELQLEQLNWDSSGSTAAKTAAIQIAAPPPSRKTAAAVQSPSAKSRQTVTSTPTSDRRTRRS